MSLREQCIDVLEQIVEEKVFFNTLKDQFNSSELSFANMLIMQSLRYFNGASKVIDSFLNKPLPKTQKVLRYVMVCAIIEILFMDTPDYAAINEYVSIGKKLSNRFAGGMINAILRKIVKDKENLIQRIQSGILPQPFRKLLEKDYKTNVIKDIESQVLEIAPLDISVKEDPVLWAEKLNGVLFENGTIRLKRLDAKISQLEGFESGQWWVQDLAASLPVCMLGDVKGLKILDLCAAPGGKTAQLLARGAYVTAVDVDQGRLKRLEENISRLKLSDRLSTFVSDGLEFLDKCSEHFDVIMLDVPCSATGTFRRHPEVLQIKSFADVKKQLPIQRAFLETAADKLSVGGKLLYCTCSIAQVEGEKQVLSFLEKNKNYELLEQDASCLKLYKGVQFENYLFDKGVLRTLPYYMKDLGGMDAFFAACMVRKN